MLQCEGRCHSRPLLAMNHHRLELWTPYQSKTKLAMRTTILDESHGRTPEWGDGGGAKTQKKQEQIANTNKNTFPPQPPPPPTSLIVSKQ